jgi:hypothetical protein
LWEGGVLRGWAEEGEEEAGTRRAAPGPLLEPVEGFEEGGGGEADEGAGPMTTEKDIEIKQCFGKVKACKVESEERRWLKVYSGIDCIVTFSNSKKDNVYDQ